MTSKKTKLSGHAKPDRWYLSIMSPNTKGEKFAWLDPTSIYINGDAFHDLLDDLCREIDPDEILFEHQQHQRPLAFH